MHAEITSPDHNSSHGYAPRTDALSERDTSHDCRRVILAGDNTTAPLQRPALFPLWRHARQLVILELQLNQRGQIPEFLRHDV